MKSLLQSCSRCSDPGHKPYLKLWQAVLMGALKDLQGNPPSAYDCQQHQREAQRWFKSHGTGIGSLNWVCEMTSLDADTIRRYALGIVPSEITPFVKNRAGTSGPRAFKPAL
jgi:hypothetical protein